MVPIEGKQEGKAAGQEEPKQAQQPAKQEEPDTKYHRHAGLPAPHTLML